MQPRKLLDQVRDKIRLKHYSIRTEQAYVDWIRRYILFHNKCHPRDIGSREIEAFLTDLAIAKKVAPSTQNQAFNAILFLYKQVLGISLENQNIQSLREKQRERIPVAIIYCFYSPSCPPLATGEERNYEVFRNTFTV